MAEHRIYKYEVRRTHEQKVRLPKGAWILALDVQANEPRLWALVDLDEDAVDRTLYLVKTGEPVHKYAAQALYVGTVLLDGDSLVLHAFVEGEPADA